MVSDNSNHVCSIFHDILYVFVAGEIISTVSHIMVPNPTKSIVAETQLRLTDIIHELQRNLSKLMLVMKTDDYILQSGMGRYVRDRMQRFLLF